MFKWDGTYSVGHEEMDKEHKQLFGLLDALEDYSQKNDSKFLERIILTLEDYIKNHFRHEEELLERAKYPQLEEHKRQHQAFKVKLRDFRMAFERGDGQLPVVMSEYLKIWLANHILMSDKAYLPYLQKLNPKSL